MQGCSLSTHIKATFDFALITELSRVFVQPFKQQIQYIKIRLSNTTNSHKINKLSADYTQMLTCNIYFII